MNLTLQYRRNPVYLGGAEVTNWIALFLSAGLIVNLLLILCFEMNPYSQVPFASELVVEMFMLLNYSSEDNFSFQ